MGFDDFSTLEIACSKMMKRLRYSKSPHRKKQSKAKLNISALYVMKSFVMFRNEQIDHSQLLNTIESS